MHFVPHVPKQNRLNVSAEINIIFYNIFLKLFYQIQTKYVIIVFKICSR